MKASDIVWVDQENSSMMIKCGNEKKKVVTLDSKSFSLLLFKMKMQIAKRLDPFSRIESWEYCDRDGCPDIYREDEILASRNEDKDFAQLMQNFVDKTRSQAHKKLSLITGSEF